MRSLLLLLLLLATIARAAETLVIGTSAFPPFEYMDQNRVVGSDTELVEAAVRRMGYGTRAVLAPWARIEMEAARGEIDIVYSITWSAERAERYYFSEPISVTRDVLFKQRDAVIGFSELSELGAWRIGTSADYQYAPEFMELVGKGVLHVDALYGPDADLRNLLKLARGRIDLFICDLRVCNYYIRRMGREMPLLRRLDYIDRVVGLNREFRVGFARQLDAARDARAARLCELFNQALGELDAEQREQIKRRYPFD